MDESDNIPAMPIKKIEMSPIIKLDVSSIVYLAMIEIVQRIVRFNKKSKDNLLPTEKTSSVIFLNRNALNVGIKQESGVNDKMAKIKFLKNPYSETSGLICIKPTIQMALIMLIIKKGFTK